MADGSTLMAYLVPRLTRQVENAATDALAYILNRSAGCMQALNDLLSEGGVTIEPIASVATQVTYEDGSRPDMAGYDVNKAKRLLVEAKFWASLLEDQASGYARQFDQPGPAVLMFISPEIRVPTLWAEITRQIKKQSTLEPIDFALGVQRAKVIDPKLEEVGIELQLVLVSWARLLDRLDASTTNDRVRSDIHQLRGLAQTQDSQAFLPIHSEELSPKLGHRQVWYKQLVDDVVDSRGAPEGWIDIQGLRVTPQWYGYGRYGRFPGVEGHFWFGVNHERWAVEGDTPLWLYVDHGNQMKGWTPIYPKLGVEYHEVLDDVISQLKARAKL